MTPYPLHRSEKSTKVMITLFLLFMVGSFTIALVNVYDKVGRVPNGVVERYGPDSANSINPGTTTDAPVATNTGGIYDEASSTVESADAGPAMVARVNTFSALLDITHPHIFEMPIIILVLCHFLMRTRLINWAKVTTYVLSFGGVAGMLGTPWLVRYVSISFAQLMIISAVALGIAAVVLIFVPLLDMWAPARRASKAGEAAKIAREQYATD